MAFIPLLETENNGDDEVVVHPVPHMQPVGPSLKGSSAGVLTSVDIRDFQRLVREHCGVALDEAEATVRANELVMLYRSLLGPLPEDSEDPADSEGSNIRALDVSQSRKLF